MKNRRQRTANFSPWSERSGLLLRSSLCYLLFVCFVCCGGNGNTGYFEEPDDTGGIDNTDGIKIGDVVQGKGKLVWRDEFLGTALDTTKWNYDYGTGSQYGGPSGWGNAEKQYYRPQNVTVEDGKLVIEAKNDMGAGNFSSGKITTKGTRAATGSTVFRQKEFMGVTQGYVEARIKTPKGLGFWPAFWMLPANCDPYSGYQSQVVGWPECGEIDIMEVHGSREYRAGQTVHYGLGGTRWSQSGNAQNLDPGTGDAYYIYGVGWSGSGITGTLTFYYEDTEKRTATRVVTFPAPQSEGRSDEERQRINGTFFNDIPWVVIINFAVGGNYLSGSGGQNGPTDDTVFNPENRESRCLKVDWVRVYE
jgi:hypothetical protein